MEEEFKIEKEKPRVIQQILSIKNLVILICILIITSIGTLVWQYTLNSKISQGLKGVYITDITDRSAVVSWVTSQPVKTELLYSEEKIESVINKIKAKRGYDIRDLEEVDELEYRLKKRGNYYVHSVLLRNLSPQTEYYFALKNGLFLNSSAYINYFSTSKEFEQVDTPDIAYGNVMNQEGELISDTLLIFEMTNENDDNKSQQVSYVMDGNTGWSINIRNLLDSKLEQKYVKDEQSYLGMYIINASGEIITRILDEDMIKPAENISTYDNEYKKEESNVKGVMAVLIDGSCTCENCTVSCPTGYESSCPSGWNCTSKTVTCTKKYRCSDGEQSTCGTNSKTCYLKTSPKQTCTCESCTPYCLTGYTFSCPVGWNCATMNSACEKYDSCTGDRCGTQSGATCYKPTSQKEECSCPACQPKCPDGFHFEACKEGYNCSTAHSSCTQRDSCTGQRCGPISTKGPVCYKETTLKTPDPIEPVKETPDSCAVKWDNYSPERKQSYYWCYCSNPSYSACVGALDLYSTYESSCSKYCAVMEETSNQKFNNCEQDKLREKSGTLITCEYGCQDNGNDKDDICKSKPIDLPQEITCSDYKDMPSCREVYGSCKWSFADQECLTSSPIVTTNCSSITNESTCNGSNNCEFVGGKCQEVDTNGYIVGWAQEGTENAYCTGLRDGNGNILGINDGTFSISTHQNNSSCSLDILAHEVDLASQMPGYNSEQGTWEAGYKCRVGEYQANGYGNNVIVTQPNGEEVIYAHLKEASCDGVIKTGQSGGVDSHLHVEVLCSDEDDCGNCLGDKNPCSAIPGGCFSCTNTVKIAAVQGDTPQTKGIKDTRDLFSLISKVRAADYEYLNPAELIEDLALPEGSYAVKFATTSKTTDFIKTDDTHIVFFEDANDNGKLDADEIILSPYEAQMEYNVAFERTADSFKLVLQEGYNLVSFPILFKDENEKEIKKASELIEYLNKQGAEITSITIYRGGKFMPYVIRDGKSFGDDFNILPGEGYFVKSNSSGEFLYSGTKVKDGLEILLYEGWNLVNIYNSNVNSYSGFEILKQMKDQSVGADILNKWEDGMYEGIVSEESGEYGTDFNVYQNRGYFVRVRENSGPFTPK